MAVNPERVQAIFLAVAEQATATGRAAILDRECGDDAELRQRVDTLLKAHEASGAFLESAEPNMVATADAPPVAERPGTVIDQYKLLEKIGEGGFGVVFVAEQTKPVRRKVALKILKPGMDTRQVVARFEAERQALAIMDHPNIAKVLDGGETPPAYAGGSPRPYFVMELVKGVPITEFCDRNRLSPRQRLELFLPVCQAVQHAHQKGIIHRDLKPSNVLVSRHDATPVVKVIDFGVAKALGQELTDKTLFTGIAQMIGTPQYMSPEQAGMSDLDVDTRSDIYSLGVLLYELLTGTTPFTKERFQKAAYDEIRRIIREEEPPRPSTRLAQSTETLAAISAQRQTEPAKLTKLVRGDLDWMVMKALEKDRNRRYQTANGLAMDVRRYLADEPVLACPPSTLYRLRKFTRRNKGRLAIAAGVFLAVTVTAATIGWALGDRAARRATVVVMVRDSLHLARTLITENKLTAAREKLAEARAQLGHDRSSLADLAAEVDAADAELDRFQQFFDLMDRAHQAETTPIPEAALAADGSDDKTGIPPGARVMGRRLQAAASLRLEALQRYHVLEEGNWTVSLQGGLLGRQQVEQIRRLCYEELLWLAEDVVHRREEHGTGRELPNEAAARQGLSYLSKAEVAYRPTHAFYVLRARCHSDLKDDAASQADIQQADETPAAIAFDHYLRGQAAFDAGQLAEATQAFEAALRLEPTHYWSLMRLGYCLSDLGRGPEDFTGAVRAFTGCILARPDGAHAYYCRAVACTKLGRHEEAIADFTRTMELNPQHASPWYNRGNRFREMGDFDKAIADYSRAIEMDPKFTAAWINRGVAHRQRGAPDKALADFSKAIEVDPENAVAWYNRGNTYGGLGELDKAFADFSRAVELDPKYANAWCNRGFVFSTTNRPDKALTDFSRAIELNPKLAVAWRNRGIAHHMLGEQDKAVADLSRAIELDPKVADAWYDRGIVRNKLGQPENAVADFSQAIELQPRFTSAWFDRGAAYNKLGQWDKAVADLSQTIDLDPNHARAWLHRGHAHHRLNRLESAITDYSKSIELEPKDAVAWYNRGTIHSRMARWDKALTDFSQAVELEPKDADAWYNRGLVFNQLNQPDKALADFSKTIELDPKHKLAWYDRGVTHQKRREPDKALADFSQAIELDPKYAIAWYARGIVHAQINQPNKSVADLSHAIELTPTYVPAWYNRGIAYAGLGQPDKALADFSKTVELDSKHAQAWTNRGAMHDELGQFDKAVGDFSQAVELNPKIVQAWANRGTVLIKMGQPERALKDFSQAIELNPKFPRGWLGRGDAYREMGELDKAVAEYSKLIELDPRFMPAWNNRGLTYYGQGQLDKAVADASRAIELDPKEAAAWGNRGLAYTELGQLGKALADCSRAIELDPKKVGCWQTLGMAHYRAGDWKAAVAALDKSRELSEGGNAVDWLFLAMAHWKLGRHDEARKAHEQAVQWLEKNKEVLAKNKPYAERLRRFRAEAEEVLELKKK